jgi:hypothetical protein
MRFLFLVPAAMGKKPLLNPSAEMLAKINENNFLSPFSSPFVCPSSSRQMQKEREGIVGT